MIPLLAAPQVAARLGISGRAFLARRARLEAAGFPPPVPALPGRWDPAAIDAWLARQRPATLRPAESGADAILLARAAAMQPPPAGE